jgi:hypothetical protein
VASNGESDDGVRIRNVPTGNRIESGCGHSRIESFSASCAGLFPTLLEFSKDSRAKYYEAIRSRDDAMEAVIKIDDRGKRELLEQIIAVYQQQAQLLVRLVGTGKRVSNPTIPCSILPSTLVGEADPRPSVLP